MKMENDFLERRREINRRAARKSRSRQKELAISIRKKYYEAQSAHTKLVYERNQLEKERNQLKTLLETHRCSFPDGQGDVPRRPSFSRSQSAIEEYAASSYFDRSISCPSPSRSLDDDDDDDDDDGGGVEEMNVSSGEDGSSSRSSSIGESNNYSIVSPLEMTSNFHELGIGGELFVPSSEEAFLDMPGLSQNAEDGSEFFLGRSDEWSNMLDGMSLTSCFMHPIASPLSAVIESDACIVTTEPDELVLRSLDDEANDMISSQASKNLELCLETDHHHQLEALDLSNRGPLSQIPRVSSIECSSKSMPTTPLLVVENKPKFPARTFYKEPAGDKSTSSTADGLCAEKTKDKQEFPGNIPLLVESFIVGEKY